MRVSFNLVRKYTSIDVSDDELIQKIGAQIGAIEEVIEFGKKFEGVLIAKVISCEKHPNADKLSVCLIDDGGKAPDVQRDQNGKIIVVCGAPNVRADMSVAWLPPGSTVPSTYDKDPFVLDARELRGVVSNGMLASSKELSLSDNHEGILEIDDIVAPGTSFAEYYNLKDDIVVDIENKMFTHRPDLFGQLGVAREIAGVQQNQFEDPDWYWKFPGFEDFSGLDFEVLNEAPEKVQRFMAVCLKDVEVKPSPVWLQVELARLGSKAVNNIVDITNYIMLLTAQPTHAYDYDKIRGSKLVSRMAKSGEALKLLNDKTYELTEADIVIADAEGAIGLAGVMGGGDSEISDQTKNVILEVANFDMYTVRRSSMRHGLFTEAVTRFSKGQSPLQNDRVMGELLKLLKKVTPYKQASRVYDIHAESEAYDSQSLSGQLTIPTKFINERLGLKLTDKEICTLLRNVHFSCYTEKDGELIITAPFWRTDISIAEDIVEEVGRLYGYDKLPLELPSRGTAVSKPDETLEFKTKLRQILSALGANEVLNYSFINGKLLEKSSQKSELAFEISNALSPDLQYYRMSLIPGLLNNIHPNIKSGYDEFALFELGKLHNKLHKDDGEGVPKEFENLGFIYSSKKGKAGDSYYETRKYLDELASGLGIDLNYKALEKDADLPVVKPFETTRSALVSESKTGTVLGIIGEFKQTVCNEFKLPLASAGFEIGIGELMKTARQTSYSPLSRYPSISQDLCLQVADSISYAKLNGALQQALETGLEKNQTLELDPIDIYSSEELGDKKRLTFRVKLTSYDRTLTEDLLTGLLNKATESLGQSINAERI